MRQKDREMIQESNKRGGLLMNIMTKMVQSILRKGENRERCDSLLGFQYPVRKWWINTEGQVIALIDRGAPIAYQERRTLQHTRLERESRMMALPRYIAITHSFETELVIGKIP